MKQQKVWIVIEDSSLDWDSYPVYVASSRDRAEAWIASRGKRRGYTWHIREWRIDGGEV